MLSSRHHRPPEFPPDAALSLRRHRDKPIRLSSLAPLRRNQAPRRKSPSAGIKDQSLFIAQPCWEDFPLSEPSCGSSKTLALTRAVSRGGLRLGDLPLSGWSAPCGLQSSPPPPPFSFQKNFSLPKVLLPVSHGRRHALREGSTQMTLRAMRTPAPAQKWRHVCRARWKSFSVSFVSLSSA